MSIDESSVGCALGLLKAEHTRWQQHRMPKRNIVVESDSDEEIVYVLGKRTVKSMPMVLNTLSEIIYWGMHDEDPQDDSSAHEVYLLDELRDGDRHLDINKILKLLEDEANHLKVMAALAVMTDYDIDLRETLDELDHEELTEFKRIWALLPRWARAADEPAAKKATA